MYGFVDGGSSQALTAMIHIFVKIVENVHFVDRLFDCQVEWVLMEVEKLPCEKSWEFRSVVLISDNISHFVCE